MGRGQPKNPTEAAVGRQPRWAHPSWPCPDPLQQVPDLQLPHSTPNEGPGLHRATGKKGALPRHTNWALSPTERGGTHPREGGKKLDLTGARVHVLNVFSEFMLKKKKPQMISKIIKNFKMMATEHHNPKQGGPLREGTWVAGCSLEKHNLSIELSHFCFSKSFEYVLCLLWCLLVYGFLRHFRIILFKRKKHTDVSCPGCGQDLLVYFLSS